MERKEEFVQEQVKLTRSVGANVITVISLSSDHVLSSPSSNASSRVLSHTRASENRCHESWHRLFGKRRFSNVRTKHLSSYPVLDKFSRSQLYSLEDFDSLTYVYLRRSVVFYHIDSDISANSIEYLIVDVACAIVKAMSLGRWEKMRNL